MKFFYVIKIRQICFGLRLVGIIQALCLFTLPIITFGAKTESIASNQFIAKDDCFCLRDSAKNIWTDCKIVADGKTVCGKDEEQVNPLGMAKIQKGKRGCKQCGIKEEKIGPVIPRGSGDEEE